MRVLVTGGAGLIGSHVVDALLAMGCSVTILDSLEPTVHRNGMPAWVPAAARFVRGDVRDSRAVGRAIEGCDAVVHMAAASGFSPDDSAIEAVNCRGTDCVLTAVAGSSTVRRVVVASSMAVYGEGMYGCVQHGAFRGEARAPAALERGHWDVPCPTCRGPGFPVPIEEATRPLPRGTYARSKLYQEQRTLAAGASLGVHASALRFFLTFGPRQSLSNPYSGICSIFATQLLSGVAPVVYEDGRQSRDMLAVVDVAGAVCLALRDSRAAGKVFNVASGVPTAIAEFVHRLAGALQVPIAPDLPRRFRPLDNRHMLGSAAALRALGWRPQLTVDAGIRHYARWVRRQRRVTAEFATAEARLRDLDIVRQAR